MREPPAQNVRTMFTRTALVGLLVVGLAACGDDGPLRSDPPATTAPVATELAPSQVTASTVVAPAGAPPCVVDDLEFTAVGEGIVAIRNTGSVECEVDVSRSPNRDPLMEPGVWLRAGGEGELAVEASDVGCAQPSPIDGVELVVNGQPVMAPVTLPEACAATLVAIYTAD
jgi:predicted small lipoprotein YifL